MIEINLLPEDRKIKQRPARAIDIGGFNLAEIPLSTIILIAGGAVALVIIFQIALLVILGIMRANFNTLDRKYRDMVPKQAESKKLAKEAETFRKKVASIDELMVKRFVWSAKIDQIGASMTPNVWLVDLQYNEELADKQMRRTVVLSGYALNSNGEGTAAIGKFIKTLKDDKDFYSDFSDIQLGTIQRDKIEDQEVMSFKITCPFK